MVLNSQTLVNAQGEALTVNQALANLNQRQDAGLRYYAAWWLGRFRVSTPAALEALILALEDDTEQAPDGSYPLRRNAAPNLPGVLRGLGAAHRRSCSR